MVRWGETLRFLLDEGWACKVTCSWRLGSGLEYQWAEKKDFALWVLHGGCGQAMGATTKAGRGRGVRAGIGMGRGTGSTGRQGKGKRGVPEQGPERKRDVAEKARHE